MFNPNRSAKGTRRYTPADIDLAKAIKSVLYDKGMKIEAAIVYLNKTYRKQLPRRLRVCRNSKDALSLLDEVKLTLEDAHMIARIEAVENWIQAENQ